MDTSPDKLPRACERLRMDAIEKKEYTSTINPIIAIKSEENVGSKKEHKNILKTLTLESGDDTAESNGNHSAGFRRRVTLGQQGMAACSGIATSFYVLAISTNMEIFRTLTTVFIFSIIVFTPLVLYKNVSTTILLRLLKEPNVVIILTYGVINATPYLKSGLARAKDKM